MLERIRIKNYAIIEDVEIEFEEGFNVFTGESGVGKSIIVDALGFALGDKADMSIIKTGSDRTIVEAVFFANSPQIRKNIEEKGFNLEDDRLIIRREYDISGKNKITVNGFSESISRISELSEILVDFHGQHEHQSLLNSKTHITYLDDFIGNTEELERFRELYKKTLWIKNELEDLRKVLSEKKMRIEFFKLAVEEIDRVKLSEGEEEDLSQKLKIMMNFENLNRNINEAYALLEESDVSVISNIGRIINIYRNLANYDNSFSENLDVLEEIYSSLKDISSELRRKKENLEYSPEEVERINTRLDTIRNLKIKYNKNTVSDLMSYRNQCFEELRKLETGDERIKELEDELSKLKEELKDKAIKISEKRMKMAKDLEKSIVDVLKVLGMDKAIFKVDFKYHKDDNGLIEINGVKVDVNEKGIDRIEFLISTNPGEDPKPLRKVASGGEISRIMLAIKSVLSKGKMVDMMVFDEIDVGIGGNTANNVGQVMKNLSSTHQIIAITHLPQVASKAKTHFSIQKSVSDNKTYVIVKKLSYEERVKEIARMSGNLSESGLKYAEEMLK